MPTNPLLFKERSARRVIRAAQKQGLVVKSVAVAPDGTISVSLAEPPRREIPLDLSREIDALVESERAKWDDAYGKNAA